VIDHEASDAGGDILGEEGKDFVLASKSINDAKNSDVRVKANRKSLKNVNATVQFAKFIY
jgi:hypothetical protein